MSKENHQPARSRKRGPMQFCTKNELRNIIGKLYDMLERQTKLRRIAEQRVKMVEEELAAAKLKIHELENEKIYKKHIHGRRFQKPSTKNILCQTSNVFNVATSVQTVIIPTTTISTQTQCRINDRNGSQQVSKNISQNNVRPRNPLVSNSLQQINLEQWKKDLLKMPSDVQKNYHKRAFDYAIQKFLGKTIPPVDPILEGLINSLEDK